MARIQNVVFDMGGVLMDWDPIGIARHFTTFEDDAQLLATTVFGDPSWCWLDAGVVDEKTIIWLAQRKLPERLHMTVEHMVLRWYEGRSFHKDANDLAIRLAEEGRSIYLLTNAGPAFPRYCDRTPAYPFFSGVLVSCLEKLLKPDARIYQLLLDRYGLRADQSLFVDDLETNVEGARRAGMLGFHYQGDAAALEAYLREH